MGLYATDSFSHLMKNMTHFLESLPSVADDGPWLAGSVSRLRLTNHSWLTGCWKESSWTWLTLFQGHSQVQAKNWEWPGNEARTWQLWLYSFPYIKFCRTLKFNSTQNLTMCGSLMVFCTASQCSQASVETHYIIVYSYIYLLIALR